MFVPASRYRQAVFAFMLALALVLITIDTVLLLRERRNHNADLARKSEAELILISALVAEPMLKQEFSQVEQFLRLWGQSNPEVLRIEARFPSGALLAEYQRPEPGEPFTVHRPISFEGQHLLDLELVKDRAVLSASLQRLGREMVIASVIVTVLIGMLLWRLVTTLAIRPLEKEIGRRQQVEEDLQKAHAQLEERVAERTGELLAAVEDLHREVIERQKAQQDLAAEKERLAVTLRSIGDGVISTDIDGRVTLLNKVAEELTGWPQAEAVGRSIDEIFSILDTATGSPCDSPVASVLANGRTAGMCCQATLVARDGTRRHISDSATPIHDEKSVMVGAVLVCRDETEKNRLAEDLQKVRKLEAVGVLAGGIAHDFNNILMAILGNIELAAMMCGDAEKPRALLAEAKKASLRARDLTGQLLTFAKGGEPIKKIASVADVIRDSASFVLRGSSVRCDYRIADDLWPVDMDKGQISQVIQNLILNASQAMPAGGVIEIACRNQEKSESIAGPVVEIAIRDHGSGIPAGMLDQIFDPYFTTKPEGSGLGLAVTHSIITKHSGRITVASREGAGTTFTIWLPASPLAAFPPTEAAVASQRGRAARILVMDDEEMVLEIAQGMLAHLGHEAAVATDGAAALSLYQEALAAGKPFDAVIMDLTVPGGMGGKEAAARLRQLDPGAKIIVASGYSQDPIMAHPKAYGFAATLAKPFDLAALTAALTPLLA